MIKKLALTAVVIGLAATGCSSSDDTSAASAGASVAFFGPQETKVLQRGLASYRDASAEASSQKKINECNRALDWDSTQCFADLVRPVSNSVGSLRDKAPQAADYHPDCAAQIKSWRAFLKRYSGFIGDMQDDFASGDFNRVTQAIDRYGKFLGFDDALEGAALAKLVDGCFTDDSGAALLS